MRTNAKTLQGKMAPLFHQYQGQCKPQDGVIYMDPRDESIIADYRGEVGSGISMDEWNRIVLTLSVNPAADGDALAEWLEADETQRLAEIIFEGHAVKWDGSNRVGELTDDAQEALEKLQASLEDITLADVMSAGDYLSPGTVFSNDGKSAFIGDMEVLASTSDSRLRELAEQVEDAANYDGIFISDSVFGYFRHCQDRLEENDYA